MLGLHVFYSNDAALGWKLKKKYFALSTLHHAHCTLQYALFTSGATLCTPMFCVTVHCA